MKAVHVLAYGELDHALALQLHDGHVCGRGEGFNQGDRAAGFRRCLVLRLQLPHPWACLQDSVHSTTEVGNATTIEYNKELSI